MYAYHAIHDHAMPCHAMPCHAMTIAWHAWYAVHFFFWPASKRRQNGAKFYCIYSPASNEPARHFTGVNWTSAKLYFMFFRTLLLCDPCLPCNRRKKTLTNFLSTFIFYLTRKNNNEISWKKSLSNFSLIFAIDALWFMLIWQGKITMKNNWKTSLSIFFPSFLQLTHYDLC